ncbi:hypothetical protein BDW62DRAFT_171494 [Aspergillus aurantiobrunneus]
MLLLLSGDLAFLVSLSLDRIQYLPASSCSDDSIRMDRLVARHSKYTKITSNVFSEVNTKRPCKLSQPMFKPSEKQ